MKRIFILFLIFVSACNNQEDDQRHKDNGTPNNPIDEKSMIELGGEKQYVEIKGASNKNPVVLFLHGGPGWPQTPHLRYFNAGLTEKMTLVVWEQSGSGQSYMQNPNPKNLSLDQIIKDGHELTQILKKKFGRDKIILAGFSWGSIVAMHLVDQYPEDYEAYISISQVVDIAESISISREWIRKQARAAGDSETIKTLRAIETGDTSVCKRPLDCFIQQNGLLTKYGGAVYRSASDSAVEKAMTAYEDYKKYDWIQAFMYSATRLENDMFKTNLHGITEIKVPAYFFVGRHDWNIPASVTEAYVRKLKAPHKEMVWFEESGHGPLEEEPEKFNQEMIKRVEQLAKK